MIKQLGVTLFEILFVLVIGLSILALSLRIYKQYNNQVYQKQVLQNVDILLGAAQNFYRAMCRQSLSPSGTSLSPGLLDPSQIPLPTDHYSLSITGNMTEVKTTVYTNKVTGVQTTLTEETGASSLSNSLYGLGLLDINNWQPNNPLISATSTLPQSENNTPTNNPDSQCPTGTDQCSSQSTTKMLFNDAGYAVQFQRQLTSGNTDQTMSVYAYHCSGGANGSAQSCALQQDTSGNSRVSLTDSSVPVWIIAISAQLNDCTKAISEMNQLDATCIGTVSGTNIICESTPTNCTSKTEGVYLVWKRPVSLFVQDQTSALWPSKARVAQFNMQYTNDGMAALSTVTSSASWYNIQHYLCGG